ncbi:MAG: hypothetical protein MUO34_06720 [Ignavibacteriaceae bacterium]|nr:hypothetical protein [Ignavibacteriaceae bacterium]
MAYLLINQKSYEEVSFENEAELEKAVVQNKKFIFGEDTVLLDYKRRVGSKKSKNTGVPDGFLFDFTNNKNPRLFFIENELESHDLYEHIGPQIMRFYASFETSKRELYKKFSSIIKSDTSVKKEIEIQLLKTDYENIDSLLNHILYENRVGIIVVIDEQTEDLNSLLQRLQEKPEVIEIKKYQANDQIVYQYIPFKEGISPIEIKKGKELITMKEVDTIVCAAREEGFKHAFIDNDAWWAVRISPAIIPQLKYLAMYEVNPVSKIRWLAKIKEAGILPYKNTGKYIIHLESKNKIQPIVLDKDVKGMAPQSPRYTKKEKLDTAQKISELWYE